MWRLVFWSPAAEYWIWKSEKFLPRKEEQEEGKGRRSEISVLPQGSESGFGVRNILTLYIASIKDVLIITPPFLSVASSSSSSSWSASLYLPPLLYLLSPVCPAHPVSLSLLLFFILSPLLLFSLLLCQMCFSLVLDETESVGLIIPDRSFEPRAGAGGVSVSPPNAEWNRTKPSDALMNSNDSPLVMLNSKRVERAFDMVISGDVERREAVMTGVNDML